MNDFDNYIDEPRWTEKYDIAIRLDEVGFPTKNQLCLGWSCLFKKVLTDQNLMCTFMIFCFENFEKILDDLKFHGQFVHHILLRHLKYDNKLHEM